MSAASEDQIYIEAAAWRVRLSTGLSQDEREGLRVWLAESPLHAAALERTERVWNGAVNLAPPQLPRRASRWKAPASRRAWVFAAGAAGTVAFTAAAVSVALLMPQTMVVEAPMGARTEARLPDGSLIIVNSGGRARVSYGFRRRQVTLEGEALFDVRQNAAKPFTVVTRHVAARVIGTRFGVTETLRSTEVVLQSGQIALTASDGGASTVLRPGDRALVSEAGDVTRDRPSSVEAELSWSTGRLMFVNERLEDALSAFERYGSPRVSFDDPELANLTISGMFDPKDLPAFVDGAARIHGLKIREVEPGRIVLKRPDA